MKRIVDRRREKKSEVAFFCLGSSSLTNRRVFTLTASRMVRSFGRAPQRTRVCDANHESIKTVYTSADDAAGAVSRKERVPKIGSRRIFFAFPRSCSCSCWCWCWCWCSCSCWLPPTHLILSLAILNITFFSSPSLLKHFFSPPSPSTFRT